MKKEKYFSKAEIKKLWLQFIFLATALSAFILYGFHAIHKQEQMFKERGMVTTMTIHRISIGYLEYEYNVNGKTYFHQTRYSANIEYNIGDKFKLVYDPKDPETHQLIRDKEKDPIPANGMENNEKYTDFYP